MVHACIGLNNIFSESLIDFYVLISLSAVAVESVNINKAHAKNKHTVAVVSIKTKSMLHIANLSENNAAGVCFPLFTKKKQHNC